MQTLVAASPVSQFPSTYLHFPVIPAGVACRGVSEVFWVAAAGADSARQPSPAQSSSAAGLWPRTPLQTDGCASAISG